MDSMTRQEFEELMELLDLLERGPDEVVKIDEAQRDFERLRNFKE